MIIISNRARQFITAGVLAALVLSGCSQFKDELLEPQQPGVIGPDQTGSPTAADALRKGALDRLRAATVGSGGTETMWTLGGLMADEWKSGDTFIQRVETDQRLIQGNNADVAAMYLAMHRARGAARDALAAMEKYLPDPKANFAQMYWVLGLVEMQLAEVFCNGVPYGITADGVPSYTEPLTSKQGLELALLHLDSALAFISTPPSDTGSFEGSIGDAARITRARTLINLGRFADAANAVAGIPTAYQYLQTFSLTTNDNPIWSFNTSQKRWVVGDSFDTKGIILNALPFASAGDPRVKVTGTTINSSLNRAFDNSTWFVSQSNFARTDPLPLVNGIDARLYEAEARLQVGDIAGVMTILNALRASPQKIGVFGIPAMTALSTPGTQAEAVTLYFREKAFWNFSRGSRLGDLRRLVRQYGRPQDQVYPTGAFFKGSNYGPDINFPVTTSESPNPNFHGCIDRNA